MYNGVMNLLSWVSPLTLLAGILGIFIYSRKFSLVEWTIALFLIISLGIDLFSRYAIDLFGFESNLFLI